MSRSTTHPAEVRRRLSARLRGPRPLLLDGALGTQLEARGIDSELPLWSTHALLAAPDSVRAVHREYVEAGAEIVTANTFRTQARTFARAEMGDRSRETTQLALTLAREAADDSDIFVAGSAAPLEDCYRPDLVPDDGALEREHNAHSEGLAEAGADLILIETMNCVREARAAAAAASRTGLPFFASFVTTNSGALLSGESLADGLATVAPFEPMAVLVNCIPVSAVDACLESLGRAPVPFGVSANLGAPTGSPSEGTRTQHVSPGEFAHRAASWVEAGAAIVGGCCGTGPEHTRAMAALLSDAFGDSGEV